MTDKIIIALLVNTAVFSALFCAMLLLRKAAGKKLSPVLMLVLWSVVLIKLIIPFGFESGFSILPAPAATEGQPIEHSQAVGGMPDANTEADNAIRPADYGINAPAEPGQNTDPAINTAGNIHEPADAVDWTVIALGIWGAGAVITGAELCLSSANLRRRIRHARTATPQYILELAEQCKKELGIRRNVGITVQSALDKPVIMGGCKAGARIA